jgi:plasmid stabilization system protein ParE
MRVTLHPEAVEDLREAAQFYRERAGSGLSRSLVDEFERSLKALRMHPGIGGAWRGEMAGSR